jgi:hypothetical protein
MEGFKPPSMSAVMGTFAVVLVAMLAVFFKIEVKIKAGYMQSMDPAYPYLQAVAMHHVNGRPFINYLSGALEQGIDVVDGVNVTLELEKFGEPFKLINSTGETLLSAKGILREGTIKEAYLAVPPGGYLVMRYEWS